MDDNRNTSFKLSTRQIEVARRNLVSVCRFTVKSLIDKACFSNVDDGCEEFINFCAVLEQVFLHRIRPHKTWYGGAEGCYFWDYVRAACRRVPQSCILSIDAIENIRSPAAKENAYKSPKEDVYSIDLKPLQGRAFIRCALMEKKLSEYVDAALKQPKITRKYYLDGAIMLSEDSNMLCGILLGLNAIDFSFCLKGENMDLLGPLAIDFTPFLQFHQSVESVSSDMEEMRELSNSSISSSIMSEDNTDDSTWRNKYKNLEHKYKSALEQKGYLEELVRLREHQVEDISRDNQNMEMRLQYIEAEAQRDRLQLENVVLELQEQLNRVKSERQMLQQRLSLLLAVRQPPGPRKMTEIQMAEMTSERLHTGDLTEQPSFGDSTEVVSSSRQLQNIQQQDNKSLLSGSSGQFTAKEDTHSMIPLTGSLTDVQFRSADSPIHQGGKTSDTELPKIQVEGSQNADAQQASVQQRGESTDRESLPDMEAEYRERPPSQAFPSFSYVDLDASLEKEENGESVFVKEEVSRDPLGIEAEKNLKAEQVKPDEENHNKDEQKEQSGSDDQTLTTGDPLGLESSSSSSIEKVDSKASDDSNNSRIVSRDGGDKSDSGNSDFDILNTDTEKSSSNESSIELAEPIDTGKSSSPTPLGDSTEDEYQKVSSDGGQTDSTTEVDDNIPEENTQSTDNDPKDPMTIDVGQGESDPSDSAADNSSKIESHRDEPKEEPKQESGEQIPEEQASPGVDSGSSEGDKDWDLLSDSSGNGQSQGAKVGEEKEES